jgi:hypothetical protein
MNSDLHNWLKLMQERKARRLDRDKWTKRFVSVVDRAAENTVIEDYRTESHRRSPYKNVHM